MKFGTAHTNIPPQVIINLLSNAIKFSQYQVGLPFPVFSSTLKVGQPRKQIDLHVDVSRHAPTDGTCNCPADSGVVLPTEVDERVPIYIYVSVRDSGPGLHPKDLELLVSGALFRRSPFNSFISSSRDSSGALYVSAGRSGSHTLTTKHIEHS